MGILYIVATPIGNLSDITFRAIEILKSVDFIACEDTRITRRLINHYDIDTKLISYHQHSKLTKIDYIIEIIKSGKNAALVSDAGTPTISDPGGKLVEQAQKEGILVMPIPGPSAIVTLLSASGLPSDKFEFIGFLPHKKGRKKIFDKILESKETIVFYESVHRIMKTLKSLDEILSEDRTIVVGRELTKYYEEIKRGTAHDVFEYFENNSKNVKGEFVVAVGSK
mgnify:CR=1 FL=1